MFRVVTKIQVFNQFLYFEQAQFVFMIFSKTNSNPRSHCIEYQKTGKKSDSWKQLFDWTGSVGRCPAT